MANVRDCQLPTDALLRRYLDRGYTDCYVADVSMVVSQADYVEAFYTTMVFRVERWILAAASLPSSDAEAVQLAAGRRERFAGWTVEARASEQLLMCDINGVTRSWLMAMQVEGGGTRLYFGSAVVAAVDPRTGESRMGTIYRTLLGFHKLYSRVLLAAARKRVLRRRP